MWQWIEQHPVFFGSLSQFAAALITAIVAILGYIIAYKQQAHSFLRERQRAAQQQRISRERLRLELETSDLRQRLDTIRRYDASIKSFIRIAHQFENAYTQAQLLSEIDAPRLPAVVDGARRLYGEYARAHLTLLEASEEFAHELNWDPTKLLRSMYGSDFDATIASIVEDAYPTDAVDKELSARFSENPRRFFELYEERLTNLRKAKSAMRNQAARNGEMRTQHQEDFRTRRKALVELSAPTD